jgi:Cytochrome c
MRGHLLQLTKLIKTYQQGCGKITAPFKQSLLIIKYIVMRKTILIIAIVATGVVAAVISCTNSTAVPEKNSLDANAERVKRGEYLVNGMGCDDCHSPKKMGAHGPEIIPELRLSGYPGNRPQAKADTNVVKQGWALFGPDLTSFVGMWGMSFAANLTSDATGIGNWKEEQFINAIRHGKYKGLDAGRDLLPPMPWFAYKNMTDEDLKSIFAWLKTTRPVKNVVPAPVPFTALK